MRLLSRRRNESEACLSGFTVNEFRRAAERLDAGDDTAAEALVARVGEEHGRCVAMAVLRFCREASDDQ